MSNRKKIFPHLRWSYIKTHKVKVLLEGLFFYFGLGAMISISATFGSFKEETITFTTTSFAIFTALASICFSWRRNITHRVKRFHIDKAGELSVVVAMLFLMATGFKYMAMHESKLNPRHWIVFREILNYGDPVATVLFLLAAARGVVIMETLLFLALFWKPKHTDN